MQFVKCKTFWLNNFLARHIKTTTINYLFYRFSAHNLASPLYFVKIMQN